MYRLRLDRDYQLSKTELYKTTKARHAAWVKMGDNQRVQPNSITIMLQFGSGKRELKKKCAGPADGMEIGGPSPEYVDEDDWDAIDLGKSAGNSEEMLPLGVLKSARTKSILRKRQKKDDELTEEELARGQRRRLEANNPTAAHIWRK